MKHTPYIICLALLAIIIVVQDRFVISVNRTISIQRDSTAYWKGRYDSAAIQNNLIFNEAQKEIKYWKDTAFFYCGKYYESLRIRNTHINNANDVYIGTRGDNSPAIISSKPVIIKYDH